MTDPAEKPAPSPTGLPVIPPFLAPYMALLCAVALAVQQTGALPAGSPWTIAVNVVVGLGGILGILSAGARRQGQGLTSAGAPLRRRFAQSIASST